MKLGQCNQAVPLFGVDRKQVLMLIDLEGTDDFGRVYLHRRQYIAEGRQLSSIGLDLEPLGEERKSLQKPMI